MNDDRYKPLSNKEITDLLTMTLHGHLPNATMNRIFSTLCETMELRKKVEEYEKALSHIGE